MNIAIVGGGWVGCHLAYKLKGEHNVTIFEKNSELFTETSYNNQNRLHYGFHYARSNKTRELCKNTFYNFIEDYDFLTKTLDKNLYCVPKKKSIVDFETYKKIFHDFEYGENDFKFKNIEGCVNTKERWIDFAETKKFFNEKLKDCFVVCNVDKKRLDKLITQYDYVINATNNQIVDKTIHDNFYELTLSLLYEKKKNIIFNAITLVDGPFFSIYPYQNNLYTVTDVEFTPLKKFKTLRELKKYRKNINESIIRDKKILIEEKIDDYYHEFLNNFNYYGYILSVKSKIDDKSDDRYPIITQKENLINCFTGKIQGIYVIEDYVNNVINNKLK